MPKVTPGARGHTKRGSQESWLLALSSLLHITQLQLCVFAPKPLGRDVTSLNRLVTAREFGVAD